MNEAIGRFLLKAKSNKPLNNNDIEDLIQNDLRFDSNKILRPLYTRYLIKKILLTKDVHGFNALDWAIAYNNYPNTELLLKYIDPKECDTNCFIRLFRGTMLGAPNKENISNITDLLLKKGCTIPDNLYDENNSPRTTSYFNALWIDSSMEAKQTLEKARPPIAAIENVAPPGATNMSNLPRMLKLK